MKYLFVVAFVLAGCQQTRENETNAQEPSERMRIIIDTDANNELDDQHALAYLFFNKQMFDVLGVTVNATFNGGDIEEQVKEAERVMRLCNVLESIPLLPGANADFNAIRPHVGQSEFDGSKAINFIIEQARNQDQLVLLPVGKLTNIALAIEKAPDITTKIRVVWLGSNYPEPGEYNQINDEAALNYILDQEVPFEIVTVRYGQASGTDAVRATPDDVKQQLAGKGPLTDPVEGRNGGTFTTFGDYSVNLFSNIDLHGDPPSRALFDMVAVAILKNPDWGETKHIPAPILVDSRWQERPDNQRQVTIWENFDSKEILTDFYNTIQKAQ